MKKPITWILIANGTQARILEHNGPGKGLSSVNGLEWAIAPLQSQDINTDKPGRGFSSAGAGRSAMEPRTDAADHREAEFVRTVAQEVDRKALDGSFDRLVIAAAPIALGNFRKQLSDHSKKLVLAELDKDLTNLPTPQLSKHFDGIIAV
ncbi:MAG: host attachment protein [Devosia sp.]|jgi:protein required for attachment to host cells|uniref:host attachment protein n=1 Tax=unclassified Devosia TaxID=196773 RepID=UPI0019F9E0D1|nr:MULTISPECIES: host attachment protein [unclassified Devosia]MBF0679404.1 host attachment protein [Devosia sp.]WEJ34684.1 host attachment protein [Devosia sp. SD17-2]